MRLLVMMVTALAVMAATLVPVTVQAADMFWSIQNSTPFRLNYKFYAAESNQTWPVQGRVYYIDPDEKKRTHFVCTQGELICYGAWIEGDMGTTWGTGGNVGNGCKTCCIACDHGYMHATNLTYTFSD